MTRDETVVDKARYLAIGATAEAVGVAWRGATHLARAAAAVGKVGLTVVRPVTDSDLFKPVRDARWGSRAAA
ncbi:MAG: hypothetical protein HZY76_05085 [Anaerolineae bacterium]|nr:MAG: hypothetical protein HZY76_05085 [Anaerolineae bacterium]